MGIDKVNKRIKVEGGASVAAGASMPLKLRGVTLFFRSRSNVTLGKL